MLHWMILSRIRSGSWQAPWSRRVPEVSGGSVPPVEWEPEHAPARAWLDEADALAAEGRFAEAVHCLLLRSIEDMEKRRPDAVRPAMTSRELAGSPLIPMRARSLFASLARVVENSLFGGRPVDEGGWRGARDAYAQFALAGTWRS